MRLKYQRLSSQDAKQEIIAELKRFQENEGFSPGRRDVPLLASYCYRHFGSFNVVKKEAGLLTKHTRIESFPQQAFEHDEDLAQIASYITFDGHLYNDLTGMMYSSKKSRRYIHI